MKRKLKFGTDLLAAHRAGSHWGKAQIPRERSQKERLLQHPVKRSGAPSTGGG